MYQKIGNAGWHCNTCFEKVEQVLGKMSSFSHTPLTRDIFRNKSRIVDRFRKRLDLWDMEDEVYEKVEGSEDVPEVVLGDRKRWSFLLDTEGENGGFVDYEVGKGDAG